MLTKGGNVAKNQRVVVTDEGSLFMSYGLPIAIKHTGRRWGTVTLYEPYWNMYSQTTNYSLLQFLNEESIKGIRKKVNLGDYLVV